MCNEVVLVENEEFKSYSFCSLIHHKLDQKLIAAKETYKFVISFTSIKYIERVFKSYSFCSLIHHKLDQKLIAANETYIFVISCTSIKYIKQLFIYFWSVFLFLEWNFYVY